MSPVARKFNMPQTNKKKKHSQTAVQSLKRLTIPLALKLTQNCYCNDFSPALPYQWLLLVYLFIYLFILLAGVKRRAGVLYKGR